MKNPIITARLKRRALSQKMSEADNYVLLTQRKNKIQCTALNDNSLALIAAYIIEDPYANAYIMEFIKQTKQITDEQTDDDSASSGAEPNQAKTDNQP